MYTRLMILSRLRFHVLSTTRTLCSARSYTVKAGLYSDITSRGFVHDVTNREAVQHVFANPQVVYAGIDPTARALHIGHLVPLMCLFHFHLAGHTVIPLIGGATGRIGDPSERTLERQQSDASTIHDNVVHLTASINTFFDRAMKYAHARLGIQITQKREDLPTVANNLDWHEHLSMIDFLRNFGVHAKVNTMINRESVRARLNAKQGLSFSEFTYQLLQAYDFYHLFTTRGCRLQIGGSDQWGNILAGLDFISKMQPPSEPQSGALGITTPLLTTASGEKFGKSAGNAVWLDQNLTSVFDFYQYFMKVADVDVGRYLHLFTLLSQEEIAEVMILHEEFPEKRTAQRKLAAEVTEMVHSASAAARAATLTQLIFNEEHTTQNINVDHVISILTDDPRLVRLERTELLDTPVAKLAAKYGLASSNSAARSLAVSRGLYANNTPIPEPFFKIPENALIDGRMVIIRAGKDKLLVLALL